MVTNRMDNKLITCINCGIEYDSKDTDSFLEICQSCEVPMSIKRQEQISFK